jgi:hypothetical protein
MRVVTVSLKAEIQHGRFPRKSLAMSALFTCLSLSGPKGALQSDVSAMSALPLSLPDCKQLKMLLVEWPATETPSRRSQPKKGSQFGWLPLAVATSSLLPRLVVE